MLATCYSEAFKKLRNLQYVRRPGPDSGCSAIRWMDGWMDGWMQDREVTSVHPFIWIFLTETTQLILMKFGANVTLIYNSDVISTLHLL
jgi:hypothetical protein